LIATFASGLGLWELLDVDIALWERDLDSRGGELAIDLAVEFVNDQPSIGGALDPAEQVEIKTRIPELSET
jgi:hypothetical protein